MNLIRAITLGGAVSALAMTATQVNGQADVATPVLRNGEIGFVVSQMIPAMADASSPDACPEGLSISTNELYKKSLTPEAAAAHDLQLKTALDNAGGGFGGYYDIRTHPEWKNPDGSYICDNPQGAPADPYFKTAVNVAGEKVEGMNLDGRISRAGKAAPGGCPAQDFTGINGEAGIDNQFYRAFACVKAYRGEGLGLQGFQADIFNGSWSLVFKLSGVDSLRDDPAIDVGVYSSADSTQFDGAGAPMPNYTYDATTNPRYRTTTKGRIVGGVLTTDPVDLRFTVKFNGEPQAYEHYMRGARFRLTIGADGKASGYLAGYNDIESFYRNRVGYKPEGRNTTLTTLISSLSTENGGYTCNGVYAALQRLADGNRDPVTGKCTSISAAMKVKASPAFVMVPPAAAPAVVASSGASK